MRKPARRVYHSKCNDWCQQPWAAEGLITPRWDRGTTFPRSLPDSSRRRIEGGERRWTVTKPTRREPPQTFPCSCAYALIYSQEKGEHMRKVSRRDKTFTILAEITPAPGKPLRIPVVISRSPGARKKMKVAILASWVSR